MKGYTNTLWYSQLTESFITKLSLLITKFMKSVFIKYKKSSIHFFRIHLSVNICIFIWYLKDRRINFSGFVCQMFGMFLQIFAVHLSWNELDFLLLLHKTVFFCRRFVCICKSLCNWSSICNEVQHESTWSPVIDVCHLFCQLQSEHTRYGHPKQIKSFLISRSNGFSRHKHIRLDTENEATRKI